MKLISFVIPAKNEEKTIRTLALKIDEVFKKLKNYSYEIIFIDDGSTDQTWKNIILAKKSNKKIIGIKFNKNYGKSQALNIGFQHTKGDIVFTMDADLQDDPIEIPNFIKKIESGFDVVSGWKVNRHDPISKTFPSKIFNKITSHVFKIKLHDINCGYKAYKKEVIKSINIYGEQHRFIPAITKNLGYSITEIPVKHHPRKYGKSKYGFTRFFKGLLDILAILINTQYSNRPGHLFGGLGIIVGFIGSAILFYMFILWTLGYRPIGNRPLFFFGILLFTTSIQLISTGVLAEMMINNKFIKSNHPNYEKI